MKTVNHLIKFLHTHRFAISCLYDVYAMQHFIYQLLHWELNSAPLIHSVIDTSSTYSVNIHSCNVHSCNFSHPISAIPNVSNRPMRTDAQTHTQPTGRPYSISLAVTTLGRLKMYRSLRSTNKIIMGSYKLTRRINPDKCSVSLAAVVLITHCSCGLSSVKWMLVPPRRRRRRLFTLPTPTSTACKQVVGALVL